MPRLDYNPNAFWVDRVLDALGDLRRQPLLYLKAPSEGVNQAGNLAQPDHLAFGNVGDMHFAEERQHMVLAEAEHFHVFYDDHLVVTDCKQRSLQQLFGIFLVSLGQVLQCMLHTLRCAQQPFTLRVFTQPH